MVQSAWAPGICQCRLRIKRIGTDSEPGPQRGLGHLPDVAKLDRGRNAPKRPNPNLKLKLRDLRASLVPAVTALGSRQYPRLAGALDGPSPPQAASGVCGQHHESDAAAAPNRSPGEAALMGRDF